MTKYLFAIAVFEIVTAFIFTAISQLFYKKGAVDFKSIFKGVLERGFLTLSLINGYHHALTFFSALKLATGLNHKEKNGETDAGYNDFYLIGNIISVSLAIAYVELFKQKTEWFS